MKNTIVIIFCLMVSHFGQAQNEVKQDSISKELAAISIQSKREVIKNKNGSLKIDVANSIFKSVPNTLDLLAKLPNIQLSPDKESITVIGKGNPMIYIDNQKVGLNDLNTLSVEDIKSIEIIKNPSAKYEAEGRAVILITRKLSKKEGFKIDITEAASAKKRFNNYFGINTSVKKKKLEWKTNFNYNQLHVWEKHAMNYQIPSEAIVSNYLVEAFTKRPEFIFGSGLFYKINEEDYFSISANARLRKENFGIDTQTFNAQNGIENAIKTISDNGKTRNFINSFVNYSKRIKPINTLLFTGFQYSDYHQNIQNLIGNSTNNESFEWAQNRNQGFEVTVFSGRTDVEKTFKNDMKLEIGGLFLDAKAKTRLDLFDYNTAGFSVSNYSFKEQNSAGYSQLSGKINKVDYSVGFRVENTKILGKYDNEITPLIEKNYTSFFPKAQINFSVDSSKTLAINYSRSIMRPNYSSTSQASTYINPYFIYASNINLNPTINNEMAVNFQYHNKSVRLSYYKNSNPVYGEFVYNNQENILIFSQKNFQKESGFDLSFTLPFTYKFWTANNSLSFIWNKIEDNLTVQKESKPYVYYYSNHTFTLPKKYTISLTAWGLSTQKEGVFERMQPEFSMDMAFSKHFLQNWDVTLSCNDVFKSSVYKESFTINTISSKAKYASDRHEISVSIKYSFGKIKEAEFREKSIDENEGRIR
jgi:hypothetical protein